MAEALSVSCSMKRRPLGVLRLASSMPVLCTSAFLWRTAPSWWNVSKKHAAAAGMPMTTPHLRGPEKLLLRILQLSPCVSHLVSQFRQVLGADAVHLCDSSCSTRLKYTYNSATEWGGGLGGADAIHRRSSPFSKFSISNCASRCIYKGSD
jgi:hypothetical protein